MPLPPKCRAIDSRKRPGSKQSWLLRQKERGKRKRRNDSKNKGNEKKPNAGSEKNRESLKKQRGNLPKRP